jgi:hypothetical protein
LSKISSKDLPPLKMQKLKSRKISLLNSKKNTYTRKSKNETMNNSMEFDMTGHKSKDSGILEKSLSPTPAGGPGPKKRISPYFCSLRLSSDFLKKSPMN